MSIISLNVDQLKSVSSEIETLDNTLVNNYLPDLESELDAIRGNVQGDELNSILNSISSQFAGVKTTLSQALPKLETFLQEQIKSYGVTEEQLKADLSAVLNKMAAYAEENQNPVAKVGEVLTTGVGGAAAAIGGAINGVGGSSKKGSSETKEEPKKAETPKAESAPKKAETPKTESAPKEENWGQKFVRKQSDNFDFKDCDGPVDYIIAGVDGAVSTVLDGATSLAGGAVELVGTGVGFLGKVGSAIGEFISSVDA